MDGIDLRVSMIDGRESVTSLAGWAPPKVVLIPSNPVNGSGNIALTSAQSPKDGTSSIDLLVSHVLAYHQMLLDELKRGDGEKPHSMEQSQQDLTDYLQNLGQFKDYIAYSLLVLDTLWDKVLKKTEERKPVISYKSEGKDETFVLERQDKYRIALALFYSFLSSEGRNDLAEAVSSNDGKSIVTGLKASKLASAHLMIGTMKYLAPSSSPNGYTKMLGYVGNGTKPSDLKEFVLAQLTYAIGIESLRKFNPDAGINAQMSNPIGTPKTVGTSIQGKEPQISPYSALSVIVANARSMVNVNGLPYSPIAEKLN